MFSKLIDRGVAFDIIRLLLSWYGSSQACVRMIRYFTHYIDIYIVNLSKVVFFTPLFYNIHVDYLMKQLSCEKLGCIIGGKYYRTIFYADDIVLLGASTRKMQKMIDICYKYGNKYGITLNPAKANWTYTKICNNMSF